MSQDLSVCLGFGERLPGTALEMTGKTQARRSVFLLQSRAWLESTVYTFPLGGVTCKMIWAVIRVSEEEVSVLSELDRPYLDEIALEECTFLDFQ